MFNLGLGLGLGLGARAREVSWPSGEEHRPMVFLISEVWVRVSVVTLYHDASSFGWDANPLVTCVV